jgi:hypothetical protein
VRLRLTTGRVGPRPRRATLLLRVVLHHAGAVVLDLVSTPDVLAHFPGLDVALAQPLLPPAARVVLGALRETRRCQRGNRKPEGRRRSHGSRPHRRRRLPTRQISGSGNAQHGDEPSRYDYDNLHDC